MAERKRKHGILLYLSDSELARLNQRMSETGVQNQSNFIRKMIEDGYVVQLSLPEFQKLSAVLGRCGNNLNQYAKMANATGSIYAKDIADLKTDFDEIVEFQKSILRELSKIK